MIPKFPKKNKMPRISIEGILQIESINKDNR